MSLLGPELTLAVQRRGNLAWEKLGSAAAAGHGVLPESVTWTHSVSEYGASSLSFTLRDDPRRHRDDIEPYTPIVASIAGVPCWSGYVENAPIQRGAEYQRSVQCVGWGQSLKWQRYDKAFVLSDLSRFEDLRARIGFGQNLRTHGMVNVDGNIVSMGWGINEVLPAADYVGVTLDLGPNNLAKRIVFTWQSSNNIALTCFVDGSAGPSLGAANQAGTIVLNTGASGTFAGTFPIASRYVDIFLYSAGGTAALTNDVFLNITSLLIATDAAYESGNASVLKASTVIAAALTAKAPMISSDQSGIAATTYSIPQLVGDPDWYVDDYIAAADEYHGQQFLLTNDLTPKPIYRAKPSTPTWAIGARDEPDGNLSNDGASLYTKGVGTYEDATGIRSEATVTTPSAGVTPSLFLSQRGIVREFTRTFRSRLTSAGATQITQVVLDNAQTAPLKGQIKIVGRIRRASGESVPVGQLGCGDAVLLEDEKDPNTGAMGRVAIIQAVSYSHDDQSVTLTLDNESDGTDNLLSRIG